MAPRLPGLPAATPQPDDLPLQALRLAVALSTAVRIEPELLRLVRVRVEPTLTVAAESDLWYGPWAARNGGAYMALRQPLLHPLRERLVAELSRSRPEDPLLAVGGLVTEAHRSLSPVLALEERVTWAAVLADAGLGHLVEHTVDELMEPALRAAVENPSRHEGLRRWFTGAEQRLPERALTSRSAIRLSQILEVDLGAGLRRRGSGRPLTPTGRAPAGDEFILAVRHDGGHITIGDPSWPATAIQVPDGPVLVLDVSDSPTRWERAERVTLRKGVTLSVRAQQVPVYLRTETGVVYLLGAPHLTGPEHGQAGLDITAGILLRERVSRLEDDHALRYGVHPAAGPLLLGAPSSDKLPALPPYLPRQVDEELAEALNRAAGRKNRRFVVLTGEPGSGRTRTLWEGMRRCLGPRWVLRPPDVISPTDLAAALREDPLASPVVLWLDDLDIRLSGESGEQLARSIVDFLGDPATGDVLLLATAGPSHEGLADDGRGLLARAITLRLPAAFSESELSALAKRRPPADPRLSDAVRHHRQGRIAQYLSGLDFVRADLMGGIPLPAYPPGPLHETLPRSRPLTGRQAETDRLRMALDPAANRRQPPVVTVTGLPGVGKTALAVEVARQAQDRRLFPGGVVFAHLNGDTTGGARAGTGAALNLLLRTLGVSSADIPIHTAGQTAMYRRRLAGLARAGDPLLLVLDNVESWTQLQLVLPRIPGVATLVTARSRSSAAGATYHVELGVLRPDDAVAMLQAAARRDGAPLPKRAEALRLAQLCGFLPLALSVVAARLTRNPGTDLAGLVAELASARLGFGREEEELSVRGALDSSYRLLTGPEARALQYLAIAPGAEISAEAAVRLLGVPEDETQRLLAALTDAHLLTSVASQRWSMHELVALYAAERASHGEQDEQAEAIQRLAAAYLQHTQAATAALRQDSTRLPEQRRALRWLTEERLNLLAMVDKGPEKWAVELALQLVEFLTEERFFGDLLRINDRVYEVASSRSDEVLLATALNNRGAALAHLRRFEEAVVFFERAHTAYRQLGDARAEARTLNNLGAALLESGRTEDAATALASAVEAYAALGLVPEHADVLDNLGTALLRSGRATEALNAFERVLALFPAADQPRRTARQLGNLAAALRSVGRPDDAIGALERAVDLYERAGARHGQAQARNNLGDALREAHRTAEAVDCLTEAVTVFDELDDYHGQAQALNNLGAAFLEAGRVQEAIDVLRQSSELHGELGDTRGKAQALNNLGLGLFEVGRFEDALPRLLAARNMYELVGDRFSEAQALNNAGNALRRLGRHAEAAEQLSLAIELSRQAGDAGGVLRARDNLGLARLEGGQVNAATAAFRLNAQEYGAVGDDRGHAQALNNLGNALMAAGQFGEAAEALGVSAELLARTGDRGAWAQTVSNLGLALESMGNHSEAILLLRESADAFAALGDRSGRFHALYNLGSALRRAGRRAESQVVLGEAARLTPRTGTY
ncbi:tetratricopeptide repeat protein [Streptomyces sp. NPDC044948]|uniref:tetratricopeptide repeat protein n=1 Tax=Streptomyces sp. NPDC044948 TaxID=3157092 RepID=UPI0033FD65E5